MEKKRLLAVHEAGHIVLAHLFPRFDWHAFSQLLPGGKVWLICWSNFIWIHCNFILTSYPLEQETAISVFYPREDIVDQGYTTFGYMQMQMVVAHGGRCAERIVFGEDITDGGSDDLEKITKVRWYSLYLKTWIPALCSESWNYANALFSGYCHTWSLQLYLFQIAREMVISPRNPRLGLTALTKRIGLVERPDNPDGEIIRYRVLCSWLTWNIDAWSVVGFGLTGDFWASVFVSLLWN